MEVLKNLNDTKWRKYASMTLSSNDSPSNLPPTKKVVSMLSATVVVLMGLAYCIMLFGIPPEFGMNGWAVHNSLWIMGLGTFALVSIAKYNKIPCLFQGKSAWEPAPVRKGRHSKTRLNSNPRLYLINSTLW